MIDTSAFKKDLSKLLQSHYNEQVEKQVQKKCKAYTKTFGSK